MGAEEHRCPQLDEAVRLLRLIAGEASDPEPEAEPERSSAELCLARIHMRVKSLERCSEVALAEAEDFLLEAELRLAGAESRARQIEGAEVVERVRSREEV